LLSSLADGEWHSESGAVPDGVQQACRLWAVDADARQTWHAYQLIGDVLRCEDLAQTAEHDAAFLSALRQRLAAEPVVLAPKTAAVAVPSSAPTGAAGRAGFGRYGIAAAASAGFVLLGAVILALRPAATGPAPLLAAAEPPTLVANGKLIRDAQLDRYLRAHREIGLAQPSALPGGAMRSVETVVLER
jgi:sigma-E factor negative regulatory protein RseA